MGAASCECSVVTCLVQWWYCLLLISAFYFWHFQCTVVLFLLAADVLFELYVANRYLHCNGQKHENKLELLHKSMEIAWFPPNQRKFKFHLSFPKQRPGKFLWQLINAKKIRAKHILIDLKKKPRELSGFDKVTMFCKQKIHIKDPHYKDCMNFAPNLTCLPLASHISILKCINPYCLFILVMIHIY